MGVKERGGVDTHRKSTQNHLIKPHCRIIFSEASMGKSKRGKGALKENERKGGERKQEGRE